MDFPGILFFLHFISFSKFSWYHTFWCFILFPRFLWYHTFFHMLFYFLGLHGIFIFHIPVSLENFPDTLLFSMQFLVLDFPKIFVSYTVLWLFFVTFLFNKLLLSFLDSNYIFFFLSSLADNRSIFTGHLVALLALGLQWHFINRSWKYRVNRYFI